MIREFLSLVRRFRSDEGGAFLVIFGVMAIVLVATSGAVVDFTSVEQARTRAQVALDSAALGLQPRIYDKPAPTSEILRFEAENVLRERLAANDVDWAICAGPNSANLPCASVDDATINLTDGSLVLEASMQLPMSFVSLVGIDSMTGRLISEATRKQLNVEVAMVLDKSGSMAQSNRMTKLKTAANCAINVLFNGDCASTATTASIDNVKIGIVPFTEFVNVGSGYRNASWMDTAGVSDIADDNFDTKPVPRFDLYDNMGVTWKGCVEARKPPYDTDDTVPDKSAPNTLFVPALAPDAPDSGYRYNYLGDLPPSCPTPSSTCTCTKWGSGRGSFTICSASGGQGSCSCPNEQMNCPYLPDRERQERMCKYNTNNTNIRGDDGPNADCTNVALLPLTAAKGTVKSRITAMTPTGYTNIHQGAMWGFHMLSPGEPLTEGKPYNAGATTKVMILMTDGENTHNASSNMNGANWYTAYGFPWNKRLFSDNYPNPTSTTDLQRAMDDRTKLTCANAKLAGITIYTIGLSSPSHVRAMLTACASSPDKARFPSDSDNLSDVFEGIAKELANLRLAQ
jgi:Flp pilus assembly protein TadG